MIESRGDREVEGEIRLEAAAIERRRRGPRIESHADHRMNVSDERGG